MPSPTLAFAKPPQTGTDWGSWKMLGWWVPSEASVAACSCWAVDEARGVPFPTSAFTEPPQTETDQGSWETLGWQVPVE